ncbi:hypothetical protein LCGC14_3118670, partial [marine sediment metagenome]
KSEMVSTQADAPDSTRAPAVDWKNMEEENA